MEAHSVSTHKDVSESPSSERKALERSLSSLPSSWTLACSSNPEDNNDCFTDNSHGFSLGEMSPFSLVTSPYASSLSLSSLSSSSSSSSLSDLQGKIAEEAVVKEKGRSGGGVNVILDVSKCVAFGNPSRRGGLFPPPISCLKLFRAGKKYVYLNFTEEDDDFIVEEIRIPRDIFHVSREGGSLKLYFACSSEDECINMEEEEEEEEK